MKNNNPSPNRQKRRPLEAACEVFWRRRVDWGSDSPWSMSLGLSTTKMMWKVMAEKVKVLNLSLRILGCAYKYTYKKVCGSDELGGLQDVSIRILHTYRNCPYSDITGTSATSTTIPGFSHPFQRFFGSQLASLKSHLVSTLYSKSGPLWQRTARRLHSPIRSSSR